ncbi:DUF7288 family protein [Halopenitus persicus]|uniref:DUF7288 family protein n=1 Tax=Halopenitus persicus TaxID=1048396 RepID=UPI000BBAB002|nr:hypothetical protein [Halopenitus persicus]
MGRNSSENTSDRGQTFTLEAFVAAILLVSTVAFGLQAVSMTSNTASAADAELRGQHVGLAQGVLDRAVENGTLKATLLYWNEAEARFYGADEEDGFYVSESPPTTFGESLDAMFHGSNIRYNVDLSYRDETGDRATRKLVESGTPSDDAVRVAETVTLYDDTVLVNATETPRENVTLASVGGDGFYAPNVDTDGSLYNVIRVEVVLWRA